MIDASRSLSAKSAIRYHKADFGAAASVSFDTRHQGVQPEWHGELAADLGLTGAVKAEQFNRLALGRDPNARYEPKQLRQWQAQDGGFLLSDKAGHEVSRVWKVGADWHRSDTATTYSTAQSAKTDAYHDAIGQWIEDQRYIQRKTGPALPHRAGADITFNYDKSVSLTAVGDPRIYEAALKATKAGLDAMQPFAQVNGGDRKPDAITGKWAVAIFPHTTARPVDGYTAPHLHHHAFWMNMGRDEKGQMRAIESRQVFAAQKYGSAVADAVLAVELKKLGYNVQQAANYAPVIAGYTPEYLKAESPRHDELKKKVAELGYSGRKSEALIAHKYRDAKTDKPAAEVLAEHDRLRAKHGNQRDAVIAQARIAARKPVELTPDKDAHEALTWARETLSTRQDVFAQTDLFREALWYGQGRITLPDVERALASRAQTLQMAIDEKPKEFIRAYHAMTPNETDQKWTTHEAQERERRVIRVMRAGQGTVQPVLSSAVTREDIQKRFAHLNNGHGLNDQQADVVLTRATSPDRITGISGSAGTGKTTGALAPLKEIYQENGYQVIAAAPTRRARHEMAEAGIPVALTLQKLVRARDSYLEKQGVDLAKPRVYVVDEMSLASTDLYLQLLDKVEKRPQDRVILVGDPRQHESIEAGRIFEEQMQAGMSTSDLNRIVRQKPEYYKAIIYAMQFGKTGKALTMMDAQGYVKEIREPEERIRALALKYADDPEHTLAVSPLNTTKREISNAIQAALQEKGTVGPVQFTALVYVGRQELTPADKRVAKKYKVGDVLEFEQRNPKYGIDRGQRGEVVARNTDIDTQWLDVRLYGATPRVIRYNPKQQSNVSVYDREERNLAVGDKLIFKKEFRGVENGDTVHITELDEHGNIQAKVDKDGRSLVFLASQMPHMDHGYVSTSYSIQGATDDKVLVDIDPEDPRAKRALKQAFAYVGLSRGRLEAQLYTSDLEKTKELLKEESVKPVALPWYEIELPQAKVVPPTPHPTASLPLEKVAVGF